MGTEIATSGETATSATAAMARANVEARFVMAERRPRSWLNVRSQLLKACERPRFAEVAIYHKPVGKGIEGPSIRLAEEAARCMGNITTDVITTYEDNEKRILQVSATDLENNLTHPCTVVVTKTVERSSAGKGQTVRRQRINSKGEAVYEVDATDDEILNKVNALVSKALRTVLLRLVPGDIMEDAIDCAYATRQKSIADDPHGQLKKLCDAYETGLRVSVSQLAAYLGHPVDETSAEEIDHLRGVYQAIKDGEATWTEAMAHRQAQRQARDEEHPPPATGTAPAPQAQQGAPGSGPRTTTAPAKPSLTDAAAKAKATRTGTAPAPTGKRLNVQDEHGQPINAGDGPPPIDDDLLARGGREPGSEG
jgi:hypothetical protein